MSSHPMSTDAVRELAGDSLPRLFERYQILGVLGQGGMGIVFRGYHINLKRHVAIKTLRVDKLSTGNLIGRFRQEMEVIGQMDHPHVVRATDAGEKNGVFYLVMELLEGVDLATLVARHRRLEAADACELVRQAALGLHYIHQTLVHRDIKPSNLMMTTHGIVKILDLGLARCGAPADREQTPDGCPVGTFAYMAPEQASGGKQIDGRADIYSLGCTLFKLITGSAPFSGPPYDSVAQQIFAHCNIPLSDVAAFKLIPGELRELVLRMTAKQPEDRYGNAAEVAEALTRFAAGGQPRRLLVDMPAPGEALKPLTMPLPDELERLTKPPGDTPTREESLIRSWAPLPQSRRTKRLTLAALGMGAVLLAVSAFFAPAWLRRAEEKTPGPQSLQVRNLDELRPNELAPLLDRAPIAIGCEQDDVTRWRWDADRQFVEMKGGFATLVNLGMTARKNYNFEVVITQNPFTGQAGVFWGYREDEALKARREPGKVFASCQVLRLFRRRESDHPGDKFGVQRCQVQLLYNDRGNMVAQTHTVAEQELPPLTASREQVLQLEIDDKRVQAARYGSVELTALFSDASNMRTKDDAYQGGLGVVIFSNHAMFSNARLCFRSNR